MKVAIVQKPAASPQIMKIQITEIRKKEFQLKRIDCLEDLFLCRVLNKVTTKI
jgi:hypothetical protein